MSTNFRCDLIWRALIRMFRRWIKLESIGDDRKRLLIQTADYKHQGQLFCEALGLCESISKSERNQFAMLILSNSHRII